MKKLSYIIRFFIICLWGCIISVPVYVLAAKSQSNSINGIIVIEILDGCWLNSDNQELKELELPEYLSAGEQLEIGEGLKIKNIGKEAYARVKATSKIDGKEDTVFSFSFNEDWIKGKDGFFYYSNKDKNAIISSKEILVVIEKISLSTALKNFDQDKILSITLTLEIVDANKNEWKDGWANNPPQEWHDLVQK